MAESERLQELQQKFNENPRRYFAPLANELRKRGDFSRAIDLCRTYLPHLPGHLSGFIVYGQALFDAGDLSQANQAFNDALNVDPENVIALRHLGDIARAHGDTTDAISWYQQVLEFDPNNDEIAAYIEELTVEEISVSSRPEIEHSLEPEMADVPKVGEITNTAGEAISEPEQPTEAEASVDSDLPPLVFEEWSLDEIDEPEPEIKSDFPEPEPEFPDPEPDFPEPEFSEPAPFITETMANVYIDQGLYAEGLEVLRQLVAFRPEDERLQNRILEVVSMIQGSPAASTPDLIDASDTPDPPDTAVVSDPLHSAAAAAGADAVQPDKVVAEVARDDSAEMSAADFFRMIGPEAPEPKHPDPLF